MLYHVRVSRKDRPGQDEYQFGFTETELQERILARYRQGRHFLLDGVIVDPFNIERIQIARSEVPVEHLLARAKAEERASPVLVLPGVGLVEYSAFRYCEEVTDQYIDGPPGEDAPPRSKSRRSRPPKRGRRKPGHADRPIPATPNPVDAGHDARPIADGGEISATTAVDAQTAPADMPGGLPVIDEGNLSVRYAGVTCRFPPRRKQLFSLLERLLARPGRRVSFADLCEIDGPWDGAQVDDSTIRGAVTRLKKNLRDAQLKVVADAISTSTFQGRGYVLFDPERLGPSGP